MGKDRGAKKGVVTGSKEGPNGGKRKLVSGAPDQVGKEECPRGGGER